MNNWHHFDDKIYHYCASTGKVDCLLPYIINDYTGHLLSGQIAVSIYYDIGEKFQLISDSQLSVWNK